MSKINKIAAGIIPIHVDSGNILMIKRGLNQSFPGTWSFFGGKSEDNDLNPKETAKREFKEESGISNLRYSISTKPIYINDSGYLFFYNFLGLFSEKFVPDLEKGEEAIDYGWFELNNLPNNMHPGAKEFFDKKRDLISMFSNKKGSKI